MKKISLMAIAIVAFSISSCKKEELSKTSSGSAQVQSVENSQYSKKIKVYDDTKEHYVEIIIESKDKESVENYSKYAANLTMELIYLTYNPANTKNTEKKISTPLITQEMQDSKSLSIRFGEISKGNSRGFRLKNNSVAKNSNVIHSMGNSFTYYLPDYCSVYIVYNLRNDQSNILQCEDYYYDNGWIFIQSESLQRHEEYYFGGVGYYERKCNMWSFGGIDADITIYY